MKNFLKKVKKILDYILQPCNNGIVQRDGDPIGQKETQMFVEIEKINSYQEKGKALIKTEDIIGIKENHVEPINLYDQDGNVASSTPSPKDFTLLLANGKTFHIDETQYTALVTELTKTQAQ